MQRLVLASANAHKVKEIAEVLAGKFQFAGLTEIGCLEDIPETQDTIEGNALQKAHYVKQHYGQDCFSEDTGLEIEALNGAPGVYTARYAGEEKNPQANIDRVLIELEGKTNRKARFKTVIALVLDDKEHLFEGICNGEITLARQGSGGFGYDPIFRPEGYTQTFAEMDADTKNKISHRGKAVAKLQAFLAQL